MRKDMRLLRVSHSLCGWKRLRPSVLSVMCPAVGLLYEEP